MEKFVLNLDCVQQTQNLFENEMINVIDDMLPLVPFAKEKIPEHKVHPKLKNPLNKKKTSN